MPGPIQGRMERASLLVLTALYLISACGFALATPYGEAPDEYSHLAYIEHIVLFHKLPDITPNPYTNESFQPPLYYLVGAAIIVSVRAVTHSWSPGGRLAPQLIPNPQVGNPSSTNRFAVLVHPPPERWPLWPYAFRALSILMGLVIVLLTYATARALVPLPAPPAVPLIAATLAALIPQANYIHASVTSESLADLVGAWIIWLLVKHLTGPPDRRRVVWLGVALGLGMITKLTVAVLALPALWVLWVRREGQNGRFIRQVGTLAGLVAVLAGWFYVYRWVKYGDPLATQAMRAMIPDSSPWQLTDLFWLDDPFRGITWASFWGNYGWQTVWMPSWIYLVLIAVTVLAVAGGVYLVATRALTATQQHGCALMLMAALLMYALVIQASTYLIAWQGRELYPALVGFCVLFGFGLGGVALGRGAVQPVPIASWRGGLAAGMGVALAAGLFALNLYSIFGLVLPLLDT